MEQAAPLAAPIRAKGFRAAPAAEEWGGARCASRCRGREREREKKNMRTEQLSGHNIHLAKIKRIQKKKITNSPAITVKLNPPQTESPPTAVISEFSS